MLSDAELADMATTVVQALPDTGTITRSTDGTVNATTGDYTAGTPTTIYDGAVHLRVPDSNEIDVLSGDEQVGFQRYVVVVPFDAPAIRVDDIFTLTEGSAASLVGVPMRVTFVTGGSWNLGYRVAVEAVE